MAAKPECTIWIDLDNTPHVPFFLPIIRQLEAENYKVVVTARDAFQVAEMAELKGLSCRKIGRHHGKNPIAKIFGLFYRAGQLLPVAWSEKPSIGLSHGSRSLTIACNLLRIPSILIADYEHASFPPLMRPSWLLVPEAIPNECVQNKTTNILKYPGIKEDVYAWTLEPNPSLLTNLGLPHDKLIVVVRPPATEAHYHNPESEILFSEVMNRIGAHPEARMILLPRNQKQADQIRATWPDLIRLQRAVIPTTAVDGLNLLWNADLVISGGGTMNREAAALGVPVYSIFRGRTGAVDMHLAQEGRLVMIQSVEEVRSLVKLDRRPRNSSAPIARGPTLDSIVSHIKTIAGKQAR